MSLFWFFSHRFTPMVIGMMAYFESAKLLQNNQDRRRFSGQSFFEIQSQIAVLTYEKFKTNYPKFLYRGSY